MAHVSRVLKAWISTEKFAAIEAKIGRFIYLAEDKAAKISVATGMLFHIWLVI